MPHILGLPAEEESLVQRIAWEIFKSYCPDNYGNLLSIEDLCQTGVIGLLEARASFDDSQGTPWLAFASFRVRGAMLDSLRKHPQVKLPQAVQKKVKELKLAHQLLQNGTEEVSAESLARQLGWTLQDVYDTAALSPTMVQLNVSGESDDEEEHHGEVIASNGPSPEQVNMQQELAELINRCLQRLTPQNRLILSGLNLYGLKLRELAYVFGCTLENIRVRNRKSGEQVKNCLGQSGWPVEAFDDNEFMLS